MDAILTAALAVNVLATAVLFVGRRRTRERNTKMRTALKTWMRADQTARTEVYGR